MYTCVSIHAYPPSGWQPAQKGRSVVNEHGPADVPRDGVVGDLYHVNARLHQSDKFSKCSPATKPHHTTPPRYDKIQ